MSTEEKIKDAFQWRADQAPDHVRVLSAVMAKTTRRRARPLIYGLIGIGVAAAVAVPVMVVGGEPHSAVPASPAPVTQPVAKDPVMRYLPQYLPTGMVEWNRVASPEGQVSRTWVRSGSDAAPTISVSLTQMVDDGSRPSGTQSAAVDINGRPGVLMSGTDQAALEWSPRDGDKLALRSVGLQDGPATLLRIARSIKSDGELLFPPVMRFGWLPEGVQTGPWIVQGEPDNWSAILGSSSPSNADGHRAPAVTVRMETVPSNVKTAKPVTVRGKPVVVLRESPDTVVWTPLAGELWLRVDGPFSKEDLVQVAETLKVSDGLSFPWLGRS